MKKILFVSVILSLLVAPAMARPRVVVHRNWTRPVMVAPGPVVVTVKPAVGWVDVNCNFDDAQVFVDGSYAGVADQFDGFPRKLELKPGSYRIKLILGDQIIRRQVFVTAGHEINLDVAF